MVIGITAGGPPPPSKSLREALGGASPALATMAVSRRAPSTDVQIFLTTLQDQQARDVWEGMTPVQRRAVAEKAGYAVTGSSARTARSSWEALPKRVHAKLAPALVPGMFSVGEIEAAKAIPEEEQVVPIRDLPSTEAPVAPPTPAPVLSREAPEDVWKSNAKYVRTAVPAYTPQQFGPMTDLEIITKAVANGQNILLLGPTGVGKTSVLERVAHTLGYPYLSVNLNGGTTVEDFLGRWVPKESGGFEWTDGVLIKFMKFGGLLVTEEVNAAGADILFALHPVMDKKGAARQVILTAKDGEPVNAHEKFVFAATMNPSSPEYEGTRPLNQAFQDRFDVVLEFTGQNIPQIIKDKPLVEMYERLRPLVVSGEAQGILSTRGLKQYLENRSLYGPEIAKMIFLQKFEPVLARKVVEDVFNNSPGL